MSFIKGSKKIFFIIIVFFLVRMISEKGVSHDKVEIVE